MPEKQKVTQTQITQKLPEKPELTQPNRQQPPTPKTKPIPQEILILTRALEEIEGIIYATRNQLLQLYGPVDYTNISDIELRFTEQQAHKLDFQDKGTHWAIYPKQYLGNGVFNDILATVKAIGGEYVAATNGNHAYFKVRKN